MVTARSLSPGQEGALEISFDGKNRGGEQVKTVRVSTNDPERETVVVTIRAYIRTAIILEPTVARVGTFSPEEERLVRLRMRIDDRENVSVTRISTSLTGISGRLVDDPDADKGKILEVNVAAGLPPGKFQETLTLHTNSPSMPEIEVPVIGIVQGS